ncbi:hypothetical protein MTsPCn9_05310 [Croceitalea sp. MTPC9]|uniref:NADPH-dependent FMN reductase n=1 Tax=unclassified Croceitalea TaxID=2632280 RepID=UPI002B39E434|nr:hypothetical protein MTsPCn6_03400 [Croceitalea sp. MTPC6]GMN15595.1 hypothetical protein MTsPCn9_05310 [Croceitalea sp. MTPC9]
MAKILALAGSNSSTSINYKLVRYTTSLIENHEILELDMSNFPFPMYSADIEVKNGYSNSMIEFMNDIKSARALVLSVNEHNGNLSAYFKNCLDWLSRIERKFLQDTKVLLMATSPGKRGGVGALTIASSLLPRFGAEIISTFSLPDFSENFDSNKGIINEKQIEMHQKALQSFLAVI